MVINNDRTTTTATTIVVTQKTDEVSLDSINNNNVVVVVPDKFICPLTLELYKDPVTDRNGHTFEKSAIMKWLQKGGGNCPLTRRPLKLSDLVPDSNLKYQVDSWRHQQEDNILASKTQTRTITRSRDSTRMMEQRQRKPVSLEDLTNYHVSVEDLTDDQIQLTKFIMGVRFPKQRTIERWSRNFRND